jgi:LysR family transcriptional regulator, carnitine catabolism transcriptional activator
VRQHALRSAPLKPKREPWYNLIFRNYSSGNPMDIDLRRIRSFLALAEHGGFGVAAEALGVSQPTLSAHIADLEQELGVPLVTRTTRRVRLTPLGERFLMRARRAVEEIQNVTIEIREEAVLQRGRVIVASTRMLAAHAVPNAIRIFQEKFPGVSVQIIDGLSPMVERIVLNGEADFGLGPRSDNSALGFQHIFREDYLLASPPAGGRIADPTSRVAEGDLITMPPGSNLRRNLDQAFATLGITIRPKFEVRDHNTAVGMVQAGLGITLLPVTAFPKNIAKSVSLSKIQKPHVFRDMGLIFQRGYKLTTVASELSAILRRVVNKQKAK